MLYTDDVFLTITNSLRSCPNLLTTFIAIVFCYAFVFFLKKRFGYIGLSSFIITANILGNIQVLYGTTYELVNLTTLLGTVTFSVSFLSSDLINENYGPHKAKQTILLGFWIQLLFLVNMLLTIGHTPNKDFIINAEAMEKIFLPIPRFLIASYTAYLASQLSEIFLYNFSKQIKIGKNSCLKHNLSLFLSSVLIDTFVFTFIAMILLTNSPLSWSVFFDICFSSVMLRIICNFFTSIVLKIDIEKKQNHAKEKRL
jgi:uncharacterized integral membrane protein (TIGR00697 family)